MKRFVKPLASLKLAVFIIAALATITAIGTIIESKYDAYAAKVFVYDTFWMYSIMGMLVINLVAVIVDRYPWKKRHVSFILAHIGIIVLLFGALLTSKYGLDGSLPIELNKDNKFVSVADNELNVYASFDGLQFSKIFHNDANFFLHPPSSQSPLVINTDNNKIEFIDFKRYVFPTREIVATELAHAGSAIRFQIRNEKVSVVDWLVQRTRRDSPSQNFGPAQIHMGYMPGQSRGGNEIYLSPMGSKIKFALYHKDNLKPVKTGFLQEGGALSTGWMGLELKILRYIPQAEEKWQVEEKEYPTPLTVSALKFKFKNKENWLLQNDSIQLFSDKAAYVLTYGQKRIDLGFSVFLKQFTIDHYEGTRKAMAYKSLVSIEGLGDHEISMNEPLKWKGLTFYQASFTENDKGNIQASVLSVNYDPGRWIKYLGSILIVLGIILLFYFKHLEFRKK